MRAQHLANLQLPIHIEQRVREQRLPLGKPQQTIWLAEPGPVPVSGSATTATVLVVEGGVKSH